MSTTALHRLPFPIIWDVTWVGSFTKLYLVLQKEKEVKESSVVGGLYSQLSQICISYNGQTYSDACSWVLVSKDYHDINSPKFRGKNNTKNTNTQQSSTADGSPSPPLAWPPIKSQHCHPAQSSLLYRGALYNTVRLVHDKCRTAVEFDPPKN